MVPLVTKYCDIFMCSFLPIYTSKSQTPSHITVTTHPHHLSHCCHHHHHHQRSAAPPPPSSPPPSLAPRYHHQLSLHCHHNPLSWSPTYHQCISLTVPSRLSHHHNHHCRPEVSQYAQACSIHWSLTRNAQPLYYSDEKTCSEKPSCLL